VAAHVEICETRETRANSVIQVPEKPEEVPDTPENRLKKELIDALKRDYGGVVLRGDVPRENLIPRGGGLLGWG
jgi:hypothetical protein